MIDITPLLKALITAAMLAISAFVIPWLNGKVGAQNMAKFLAWVDIAVRAAEQIYADNQGDLKKQYVLNYLTSQGFYVDAVDLELAIEASVNKLHHELYGVEK